MRITHLLQTLDASQQVRSLVAMQYPPTYTYLVSSTVGISCILEIAFASTRVGLQWGQMMFWESLYFYISLLIFCLSLTLSCRFLMLIIFFWSFLIVRGES